MQELKEESNDMQEKNKKRKIIIKPKLPILDVKEAAIFANLFETNHDYLKEIFTENRLEELKRI